MTRHSQKEKEQTHQRIVEKAGEQMRLEGVNGAGIAELMAQAGLTHGGFYAHFRNKDALLAEICHDGMAETLNQFLQARSDAPAGQELAMMLDLYLSLSHRDNPAIGCSMPTLAADVARRPEEVRTAFTEGYEAILESIAPGLSGKSSEEQYDAALVLLSGIVGAMLLSRAINNPELSERLLRVNRDFYARTFAPEPIEFT